MTALMGSAERAALLAAMQLPYPSFPCLDDKRPACPTGFKAACRGVDLRRLWERFPGVLVGIPTGSASGISVLDVDIAKGGDAWWKIHRTRLPLTRLHETRSGGFHALFRHRHGLKCSVSKIASGIDVRAAGGYIIHWPSHGFSVVDHPLADWPEWLVPPEPERPVYTPSSPAGLVDNSRYGSAALDSACAAISGASNGSQNHTLNREAFSIGQLAGASVIDRGSALDRLTAAAYAMPNYDPRRPWTAHELTAMTRRSFEQGLQRPRAPVHRSADHQSGSVGFKNSVPPP